MPAISWSMFPWMKTLCFSVVEELQRCFANSSSLTFFQIYFFCRDMLHMLKFNVVMCCQSLLLTQTHITILEVIFLADISPYNNLYPLLKAFEKVRLSASHTEVHISVSCHML